MLNSRGANYEPSGTTVVILSHSRNFLVTLIICFLFIKKLFICHKASVSNPYAPNLATNKSWSYVPKVFDRFMNIAQI